MASAVRSGVLAFIGLALVAALSSCGSGSEATSPDVSLQNLRGRPEVYRTAYTPKWHKVPPTAIAEANWGRVRAAKGLLEFTLGPNLDRRRRRELQLGRVPFTAARIMVADDERGTNLVRLEGKTSAGCLFHAQGDLVHVIIATRRCVPIWATTEDGAHARMWIRVENLGPHATLVYMRYATMTS